MIASTYRCYELQRGLIVAGIYSRRIIFGSRQRGRPIMKRLPQDFSGSYKPGPVTIYLDDLTALIEIIGGDAQPSEGAVEIFADIDGSNLGGVTHQLESLDELRPALGRRLRRTVIIADRSHDINLTFDRALGFHLIAKGETAESRFQRAKNHLQSHRRAFAPLVSIPFWTYPALLAALYALTEILRGKPLYASPGFWVWSILTLVGAIGPIWWGHGAQSAVFLVRRHELTEETQAHKRDVRGKVAAAVIGSLVTIAVALASQACPALKVRSAPADETRQHNP